MKRKKTVRAVADKSRGARGNMKKYCIEKDIRGEAYKVLIDFLGRYASSVLLIAQDHLATESCQDALRKLADFGEEVERVSEWPGTKLFGGTVLCHKFRASQESLAFVRNHVDSLFSWCWPENPEDLSFAMRDGRILLLTTAHESYAEVAVYEDMVLPPAVEAILNKHHCS